MWARRWDRVWSVWLLTVFVMLPIAAWFQHIHTTVLEERWLMLVFGAVLFPVGVLHGIAIWLGLS